MTDATNAFRVANRWGSLQPSSMLKIFNAAATIDDLSNLSIGEPDFDTDIDIVDAAAKRLVWESIAVGRVTERMRNDLPGAIRKVVPQMLATFPSAGGGAAPEPPAQ